MNYAQVEVQATVDSTEMVIGDKFQLHLSARHPLSSTIESIDISGLQGIKNMDIEAESEWDTTNNGNQVVLTKDFTFQVWDSGYYWIPEIPFVTVENGTQKVVQTNRIPITVYTVAIRDSVEIAPIKPILLEGANWQDYILYLLPVLLIGLLVGLLYWMRLRKQKETAPPPKKIIIPAHTIALNALSQLKSEELWQKGDIKAYQSRLTHIIREYLENRYKVPALESTTDEILRHLKTVDFNEQWKDKLSNILQVADLVKFAKAEPAADFHERVWQEANDFVINTKVELVEDTEGSKNQKVEDNV